MQGKGLIKFFLIILSAVCIYQFGLMLPTRGVEKRAEAHGEKVASSIQDASEKKMAAQQAERDYLDSISSETVLNLGFKKFTYQELKGQQLALGLDLKGGMSVVMQVDLKELVTKLSDDSNDPDFKKAITRAIELQRNSQSNYIELFQQAFEEIAPNKQLSSIFATNTSLREKIKFDSSNDDVIRILREEANETVGLTFKRLKERIDKFGVTQPNVTLDSRTDRIIVELPGVKNPERVRKFLQQKAELEFWDCFRISDPGMVENLNRVNDALKNEALGENTPEVEDSNSVAETVELDSNGVAINTIDSTKTEIPSPASLGNEGPLFDKLSINTTLTFPRSVIGSANGRDTAAVNKMLAEHSDKFPNAVRWNWSSKSTRFGPEGADMKNVYELYAIDTKNKKKAPVEGGMVTGSRADINSEAGGAYVVSLTMNGDGAKNWREMTRKAVSENREAAILLDGEVVSAPSVQSEISDGRTQITGNFSSQEAQDLSNILQIGKLPASPEIIEEAIVGPSLGADNIRRSIMSLVIGFSLVLAFMILYYGTGGIVSIIALFANLFFIFGSLASIGTVLTLPGIAGIVLTIGMAVDANVIIYERIREELRDGKGMLIAIKDGFNASYSAIIDANITTILTAIVLFYFGLGPIKGFAAVLIIGVISSVFCAVLVGKLIIDWWTSKGRDIAFSTGMSESAFANVNIDFVSKRKTAYVVSGLFILAGFVSYFVQGFDLGVDFKGGYSYAVQFDESVSVDQNKITTTLSGDDYFGSTPVVKTFGGNNTYEITTDFEINNNDKDAHKLVEAALLKGVNEISGTNVAMASFLDSDSESTHITRSIKVGPTIADDIKQSSLLATFFALILIFTYILFRFRKWQYSMGAIGALFHDVLVVLSVFTIGKAFLPFSVEIDQTFIAAILTVIGYSINDTVVVFDRIREFTNSYSNKSKKELFNLAVNNTISRTIITSLTTLFVVFMLFIFSGGSIKGFAFALVVGIFVGTYSSVFVATPIVYDLVGEDIVSGNKTTTSSNDKKGYTRKVTS